MQNMYTMIIVTDMERSVGFYRDTLGLKLKFQSPDWSEFDMGTTTLALHGGGKPAPPKTGSQETYAGTAYVSWLPVFGGAGFPPPWRARVVVPMSNSLQSGD